MKTVPILHYETTGSGPTVVLLHGYMASSRYWQMVTTRLATNHRVIAIDLLGFGASPKPTRSKYDYSSQLQSLEATLAHIGVTHKFTLVGHSMGSLISLRYAREHPERVAKLVLTNMPILLNRVDAKQEIYSTLAYRIGLQPVLHHLVWPLFKLTTRLRLVPARVADGAASRVSYIFQNSAASRLRSMRNVIFAAKIQADLAALDVATVVINGLQDRERYLKNLATLDIGSRVRTYNVHGGHHLPLTKPDLIASLI